MERKKSKKSQNVISDNERGNLKNEIGLAKYIQHFIDSFLIMKMFDETD